MVTILAPIHDILGKKWYSHMYTYMNVSESHEVAALTVSITMPPRADPIEKSFPMIVNALDGTATGVP